MSCSVVRGRVPTTCGSALPKSTRQGDETLLIRQRRARGKSRHGEARKTCRKCTRRAPGGTLLLMKTCSAWLAQVPKQMITCISEMESSPPRVARPTRIRSMRRLRGWRVASRTIRPCRTESLLRCCDSRDEKHADLPQTAPSRNDQTPSDNTARGGRRAKQGQEVFPLALPDATQQTSLRRNRTSFERHKCTKRGGSADETQGWSTYSRHADAGRAALQQTPSDNTAPRGGQEDEARPGGLSARSPRRVHSKPRYGETGRVSRGASVQREEASAENETQGWSTYSPHAGGCRTCCSV